MHSAFDCLLFIEFQSEKIYFGPPGSGELKLNVVFLHKPFKLDVNYDFQDDFGTSSHLALNSVTCWINNNCLKTILK